MVSSRNVQIPWPTLAEYDRALDTPLNTVYDPDIKTGKLFRDMTGPYRYNDVKTGVKYVSVYRVGDWIVKCFIGNPPPDMYERYQAINNYIKQHATQLSFLVPHQWVEQGISINGRIWPFIKSQYIAHISLGSFLGDMDHSRYKDCRLVSRLAEQWLHIVNTFEALEMAHGDLDITNVFVCGTSPNVTLRLIDFDSMYVPALKGRELRERGHEHFQPFEDGVRRFDREMDRFSALIIYLSLIAIAEDSLLWETTRANEEDKLLLGSHDYKQLGTSPVYLLLRAKYQNDKIRKCMEELAASIQEKRMPKSLAQILSLPEKKPKIVLGSVEQSGTGFGILYDDLWHGGQTSPFLSPPPPLPPRQPTAPLSNFGIPEDYLSSPPTMPPALGPSHSREIGFWFWLLLIILILMVILAMILPGSPILWFIAVALFLALIVVGVKRQER